MGRHLPNMTTFQLKFALAVTGMVQFAGAASERPLKVEIVGSKEKAESCSVILAYGSELSGKIDGLDDQSVYAMFDHGTKRGLLAKVTVAAKEVLVPGERQFSGLSYLALFMPDNFAEGAEVVAAEASDARKFRFVVEFPADPQTLKMLTRAEREAIRDDDRTTAAECRWLQGDWNEAARHLELAGRDFFRKKDPSSRIVTSFLEGIARSEAAKKK